MTPALKGTLLMLAGTAFLSGNDAVSKLLTERYPVGQVVCLRQVASLLVIVPLAIATTGLAALAPVDKRGQLWRGLAFLVSAVLMVASLAALPLAIVSAIAFSTPLWVGVLAGPLLGEAVPLRRWLAIGLGFAGVLVIIRPGGAAFTLALLLPVATAIVNAGRDMLTRSLARTETSIGILFWSALIVIAGSATTVATGWKPVPTGDAILLILNGVLNGVAHFAMIAAFRHADASAMSLLRYASLVWAVLLGWILWAYIPNAWTLAGGLVVVLAAVLSLNQVRMPARRDPGLTP